MASEQDVIDYGEAARSLLPRGRLWAFERESRALSLARALGVLFAETDDRAEDAAREADPRSTIELVSEWEEALDLEPSGGLAQRRAAIVAALLGAGGQTPERFVALAASLGYLVEIDEPHPFEASYSVAGDALTNGDWVFTWILHAPVGTPHYARCGEARIGDRLVEWSTDALETRISETRPAHTRVIFRYDLPRSGYSVLHPATWTTVRLGSRTLPTYAFVEP